jgi:hypothetical protein
MKQKMNAKRGKSKTNLMGISEKIFKVTAAPIAVGYALPPNQYKSYAFKNGIGLRGRAYIGTILNGPGTTTGTSTNLAFAFLGITVPVMFAASDGTPVSSLNLDPGQMPFPLNNYANMYTKFRWRSNRLDIIPRVPSTTSGSLRISYFDDIINASALDYPTIVGTQDTIEENNWVAFSLTPKSLDRSQKWNNNGTGGLTFQQALALNRQSIAGQYYFYGQTSATGVNNAVQAVVFMDFDIQFEEIANSTKFSLSASKQAQFSAALPGPLPVAGLPISGLIDSSGRFFNNPNTINLATAVSGGPCLANAYWGSIQNTTYAASYVNDSNSALGALMPVTVERPSLLTPAIGYGTTATNRLFVTPVTSGSSAVDVNISAIGGTGFTSDSANLPVNLSQVAGTATSVTSGPGIQDINIADSSEAVAVNIQQCANENLPSVLGGTLPISIYGVGTTTASNVNAGVLDVNINSLGPVAAEVDIASVGGDSSVTGTGNVPVIIEVYEEKKSDEKRISPFVKVPSSSPWGVWSKR